MRTRRASKKVRNDAAAAVRAIEHCRDAGVLDVILQRVNAAADKAEGDDLLHLRLVTSIAERRLAELRAGA